MKPLTFKGFLKGYYQTGRCLRHDSKLLVEMHNLGWFSNPPPYSKRNKHFVPNQGVPEWFEESDRVWTKDIRIALDRLDR